MYFLYVFLTPGCLWQLLYFVKKKNENENFNCVFSFLGFFDFTDTQCCEYILYIINEH